MVQHLAQTGILKLFQSAQNYIFHINSVMNLKLRSDILHRLITMMVQCLDQSVEDNSAARCWYW